MHTDIDPRKWLDEARAAAAAGRYEDALQLHVKFHNHALEYLPSLYGVRLSFALGYWVEFSNVYPEAGRVLYEIRDRKALAIVNGEGNREIFHDVVAINRALCCESDTHDLFLMLNEANPVFAAECMQLALPAIVKAGNLDLAYRIMPSAEEKVRSLSFRLNEHIVEIESCSQPKLRLGAYIHNYTKDVQLMIDVLAGVGRKDQAGRIKDLSINLIDSMSAREAVRNALENNA
jgi:hypothetical protein